MSGNVNLGRTGKFGQINLNQFDAGIKKSDMKTAEQIKLFQKLDKNNNGVLEKEEMETLLQTLGNYAEDGKITRKEAKKYLKENGLQGEMKKREVLQFFTELGIFSDNIENTTYSKFSDGVQTINIEYKPNESGETITDMINKENGLMYAKKTVKDGKTVTQYFDEAGKVKQDVSEENGVKTIVKYDENGNITQTIRQKGSVTEYLNSDGKVTKKETEKGNGIKEIVEYEYGKDGEISKTTTTNPDGSQVIAENETITTINTDGSKTVQNLETGEIQEFDKDGKIIEKESEQKTPQDALKVAFGDKTSAKAVIDGSATGLAKAYEGEIRLPKGETIEYGKFPKTLNMTLPSDYGKNAVMQLTLVDAENGIYETSAHDRNFQITTDENGNIFVKSVNVEELSGKLNANLAEYTRIENEKQAEELRKQQEEMQEHMEEQVKENSVSVQKNILSQAKADFENQLANDGWAGKTADAVSWLWGSENRAVKVRADIERYDTQLQELERARLQGKEQFKTKFKEIFGVDYNSESVQNYINEPSDENYLKAYGSKNDIARRVAKYNESQQKGAAAVKTTVVVAASAAAAVATGGASLAATAAVAGASTAAARTLVEVSDLATNDVDGDVNMDNLNNIANQAMKEGLIAGATAGIVKGAGALAGKGASAASSTASSAESGLVRTGTSASESTLVKAGSPVGGLVKATGGASKGAGSTAGNAASSAAGSASQAASQSTKSFISGLYGKVANTGLKNLTSQESSKLAKVLGITPEKLANLSKKECIELIKKFHPDRCRLEYANDLTGILNKMLTDLS